MFNLADNMLFTNVLLEQREKLKEIMDKVGDHWDIMMRKLSGDITRHMRRATNSMTKCMPSPTYEE